MKNKITYILLTLFLFTTNNIFTQGNPFVKLPQLFIKNPIIENPLSEISDFFGSKKKGMYFPICKILFYNTENNNLLFEVEPVDNSWSNLFRADQVTYGYLIVKNRMYLIISPKNDIVDLNNLFYGSEVYKNFDQVAKPPTWNDRIPKWHFENNNQKDSIILISSENLDILD